MDEHIAKKRAVPRCNRFYPEAAWRVTALVVVPMNWEKDIFVGSDGGLCIAPPILRGRPMRERSFI